MNQTTTTSTPQASASVQNLHTPAGSFARRIIGVTGVCILLTLALAGTAIWGMARIQSHAQVAGDAFAELRRVYEIGSIVEGALSSNLSLGDRQERIRLARLRLDEFAAGRGKLSLSWMRLKELLDKGESTTPPDAFRRDLIAMVAKISNDARLRVSESEIASQQIRRRMLWTLSIMSVSMLAVMVGLSVRLYRSITRPMQQLMTAAGQLGAGQLAVRAPLGNDRETHQLGRAFNTMAGQLEELCAGLEKQVEQRSRQLVSASRLANLGYLAAGVVHEINNPLAIIDGYAQRAVRQIEQGQKTEASQKLLASFATIREEVSRMQYLTGRLLSLARPQVTRRGPLQLDQVCRQAVDYIAAVPAAAHVAIRLRCSSDCTLFCDAEVIRQIIFNLLLNAVAAVKNTSSPWIEIDISESGPSIQLIVSDNGCGMTPQIAAQVFEPFFTTRSDEDRAGAGLGLSIVQSAVDALGGTIVVHSDGPEKGSRFTVTLPIQSEVTHGQR